MDSTDCSKVKPGYVDPHLNQSIGKTYVVYVYVDYRKDIGTRVVRTYMDRQKAIEFAESLSAKSPTTGSDAVDNTPCDNDNSGASQEHDPEHEEDLPEYNCQVGGLFDARVRFSASELIEFGILDKDDQWMWYLRVGVEEVNLH
jgi:hypothetical protein